MRDYSSISPSAKTLLLLKGFTDIPFIADAVELIWGSSAITALDNRIRDEVFLKRLLHFELRYKSIDHLLETLGGHNILEISSGFSFRGLHRAVNNPAVTYIDTDLSEVIETKKQLTEQLIAQQNLSLKGALLTLPMNALDEANFTAYIGKLPPGPVNIINEGLLVYLNTEEKTRLSQIIHRILSERGGCWITADIYIRKDLPTDKTNDHFSDFLKAHHVEDNKFESFTQAERFFNGCGFKIHKKSERISGQLSALKYINPADMPDLLTQAAKIGRIRETWALVPV
jgi:O-methyltransferase involved in polyketide biosynthesis